MGEKCSLIKDYIADRRELSKEQFVQKYPYPFLVEKGKGSEEADQGTSTFSTMVVSNELMRSIMAGGGDLGVNQPVLPLVKRGSHAFSGMITVGRAPNNDIVIDSPAVSKFHAYFGRSASTGYYCITDGKSTNGTFVNGKKLGPHAASPLKDGDVVSISNKFEYTHYTAGGLYEMLKYLAR